MSETEQVPKHLCNNKQASWLAFERRETNTAKTWVTYNNSHQACG